MLLFAYNYNRGLLDDLKVSKAEFGHRFAITFAPVLPRDIEAINQTIQIQRGAGVMSKKRAVNLSPDVENPEAELEAIAEEEEEAQENRRWPRWSRKPRLWPRTHHHL